MAAMVQQHGSTSVRGTERINGVSCRVVLVLAKGFRTVAVVTSVERGGNNHPYARAGRARMRPSAAHCVVVPTGEGFTIDLPGWAGTTPA